MLQMSRWWKYIILSFAGLTSGTRNWVRSKWKIALRKPLLFITSAGLSTRKRNKNLISGANTVSNTIRLKLRSRTADPLKLENHVIILTNPMKNHKQSRSLQEETKRALQPGNCAVIWNQLWSPQLQCKRNCQPRSLTTSNTTLTTQHLSPNQEPPTNHPCKFQLKNRKEPPINHLCKFQLKNRRNYYWHLPAWHLL